MPGGELRKRKPIPLGELLAKSFPPGASLIGSGLLQRNSILVIGGPPKSYKSFLLNTILYHLATATPVFGASRSIRGGEREPVFTVGESCRVLLLEQEIGEEDLQLRFRTLLEHVPGPERILCSERIYSYSCDYEMQLDHHYGRHILREVIGDVKPQVVAFDPLVEFHTSDENSSKDMVRVLHGIDELRQEMHFATIINHHLSKPRQDDMRTGPDRLRGSSVLYGKGDSFLTLVPDGRDDGLVEISFKLRRARPVSDMFVRVDLDTLLAHFEGWKKTNKSKRPDSNVLTIDDAQVL